MVNQLYSLELVCDSCDDKVTFDIRAKYGLTVKEIIDLYRYEYRDYKYKATDDGLVFCDDDCEEIYNERLAKHK